MPTHGRRTALYTGTQALARGLWRLIGGSIEIHGIEHVSAAGPVLIISNHQSLLDPILTQAVLRRPVHAMAKSTQFTVPAIGWLMRHLCVFPVRRFQIDPQATRHALRLLDNGEAVLIYIEGERSWNRQLQDPRPGTARLALRTSAPTVLCAISGTYDAWPRWNRRPRPARVSIRFTPIDLPTVRGRANRDLAPSTARTIMAGLDSMLGRLER
jgi:1-acyl-sn-glycerol-3-phosphate acyltransferase